MNFQNFGIDIDVLGLSFFNGKYSFFMVDWYRTIGVALFYTMVLNMVTINMGTMIYALKYKLMICFDRGCTCNVMNKKTSRNTKQDNQQKMVCIQCKSKNEK